MFSTIKQFLNWITSKFSSSEAKTPSPEYFPEVMEVFPDEDSRCKFDYNRF